MKVDEIVPRRKRPEPVLYRRATEIVTKWDSGPIVAHKYENDYDESVLSNRKTFKVEEDTMLRDYERRKEEKRKAAVREEERAAKVKEEKLAAIRSSAAGNTPPPEPASEPVIEPASAPASEPTPVTEPLPEPVSDQVELVTEPA